MPDSSGMYPRPDSNRLWPSADHNREQPKPRPHERRAAETLKQAEQAFEDQKTLAEATTGVWEEMEQALSDAAQFRKQHAAKCADDNCPDCGSVKTKPFSSSFWSSFSSWKTPSSCPVLRRAGLRRLLLFCSPRPQGTRTARTRSSKLQGGATRQDKWKKRDNNKNRSSCSELGAGLPVD